MVVIRWDVVEWLAPTVHDCLHVQRVVIVPDSVRRSCIHLEWSEVVEGITKLENARVSSSWDKCKLLWLDAAILEEWLILNWLLHGHGEASRGQQTEFSKHLATF